MQLTSSNYISHFVKYQRNKLGLTQEGLAEKAGVGLRFIRELEQGKETLRMDKVNQVLALFGHQITTGNARVKNPYEILMNHFSRMVHVFKKDKNLLIGFLIEPIMENNEIVAWKFVSNNNSIEYQKTKNPDLVTIIRQNDIENIENI